MTRLLLTRVPFFRELIVSSFSCAACGWADAEIQPAGSIQERGVRYALAVGSRQVSGGAPKPPGAREVFLGGGGGGDGSCALQDMNREVVKTDCATARIPELDFEIPAFSQKGGGYGAGPPPLPPSGPAAAPERCPCASVLSLSSSDHHRRHNRQSCHGPGAGPACPLGKLLWHRNPLRDLVHACFVAPLPPGSPPF